MAGKRRGMSPTPPEGTIVGGGGTNNNGRTRTWRQGSNSSNVSTVTTTRRSNSSNNPQEKNTHHATASFFNPRLIFSQMIALQCFHYLILGFIIQCNSIVFNTTVTIDRIFTDKFLNVWSLHGWVDNSAILLSYMAGAVLLATIVEKSKKCLDFSATLFLINLLVCSFYGGLPSTWDWWIIHILGTIVMILLGEYLCSRRELSDIPLLDF